MARNTILGIVFPAADLVPGCRSCELRFDDANTTVAIEISPKALGIQIFPRNNDVRFALDVEPQEAIIVTPDPMQKGAEIRSISNVSLAQGALAKANTWTRRFMVNDGLTHTLYVRSQAAATNVDIEVF